MRADRLTVLLDSATAADGHVALHFTDVSYAPTWNGIQVTPATGTPEFFNNVEIVGYETFTYAAA
jgi:hypothetical protein